MTAPSKPAVLAPRDDERVEVVLRHRGADVGVAALELGCQRHESSSALTSCVTASLSGVGTPELAPEARDAAVQVVDLGRAPRFHVLEHARFVIVRDVGSGGVVDQLLRVRVEDDPLRGRDRLALLDERTHECAQVRPLADAPVRQPGERADRVRGGVEDHLAPLRRPCVRHGGVGIPPRVHASASRSTSSSGAGLGSNGPSVVSPLYVPLHETRAERIFPAGNVVPRITRVTWLRDRLLVADAVLDGGDRALGECVGRRGDRGRPCASPSRRRCRSRTRAARTRPPSRARGRSPRQRRSAAARPR